jgi:hypothetical protein
MQRIINTEATAAWPMTLTARGPHHTSPFRLCESLHQRQNHHVLAQERPPQAGLCGFRLS